MIKYSGGGGLRVGGGALGRTGSCTCESLESDARYYFLGLKFDHMLSFCIGTFLSYFLSFGMFLFLFWAWQISSYFFEPSNFCITHMNPLN